MRLLTFVGFSVACALLLGIGGLRAAGCDPVGSVRFVCNQAGPEDLFLVPGGEWVLSSGMVANGAIRLIRVHRPSRCTTGSRGSRASSSKRCRAEAFFARSLYDRSTALLRLCAAPQLPYMFHRPHIANF